MKPMITILASAVVPNGRFGDHHISVECHRYDDGREEFVWRDGYSDPLICTGHDDAMRFFHERTAQVEA